MRRAAAVIGIVAVLGLSGCAASASGTSNDTDSQIPGSSGPITGPIDRTKTVVGDLNSQLDQEEQRTGSEDPTVP